jgi:hypothetical protein
MMPKRFEQPLSIRASPVLHFPDSCFDYYRIEKLLREFSFLEPQMLSYLLKPLSPKFELPTATRQEVSPRSAM